MPRRVIITAVCQATVEEDWKFDVPDDWTDEKIHQLVEDEGIDGFTNDADVVLVTVVDANVSDEHDREIKSHDIEEVTTP